MKRILLLYGCSGFLSLGYQVAWFRIFTDWYGSTNLTFALVVANFIGGLAVGGMASRVTTGSIAGRWGLGRGLRVYGLVELLVAASILLTFLAASLPADILGSFPYREVDGVFSATLGHRSLQALVASVCVFVPCFFMGVTFPLLCERFIGHPEGARFPALLYACNTLGACSGVLACQFLFLPALGHDITLGAMAALNALLGIYFLTTRSEFAVSSAPRSRPPTRAGGPSLPKPAATLLAFVTLGGFVAGALEGDLFKRVTFVIELNPGATMSFISFWAVLAIFLASLVVHRFPGLRIVSIKAAIALAVLYCVTVWPQVDAIRDLVEATVSPANVEVAASLEGFRNLSFPTTLLQLLVFVGIMVFPPYFLVSLLLPRVCNQLQADGSHLGLAYGLNTVAFCAGLLGFVLIAPQVNIFYSLELFVVVFAVAAAWLFVVREGRPFAAWQPGILVAALGLSVWLVPDGFDPGHFRAGTPPAVRPVRAVKSDGANTTFVVDFLGSPRLYFGRLQMSGTNLRAQTYMRLMAHFPLLLHPKPERALLICFGAGNTASAIARHESIQRIDVVDLNANVFETAPEFAATNADVHLDPRVRFIEDDGRNFLNLSDERYDLVTSEPPPPLAAGVHRLYSREYYRQVRDHLTPNGFMTQWLPLFLMTPAAVEMAVSTFIEVFPHTFLFTGYGTDFILLGSRAPIDASTLDQRLQDSDAVARELARYNIRTPASLLARIVQSDASLRRNYGKARAISDQRNDLEHMLPDPRERPIVSLDPGEVVAFVERIAPRQTADVEAIVTHLGRLRYHVQGYPVETLSTVEPVGSGVALANVDWIQFGELLAANTAALRTGVVRNQIRAVETLLDVSREQPEALLQLARLKLAVGRSDEAILLMREFLLLEPDEPVAHALLAHAYERAGMVEQALAEHALAARLQPDTPGPLARMAWIHATSADPSLHDPRRALEFARRATELSPDSVPRIQESLAAAYAASGDFDRAIAVVRAAIEALPDERQEDRRRLWRQQRRYQKHQLAVD